MNGSAIVLMLLGACASLTSCSRQAPLAPELAAIPSPAAP
jgi:hypothetical protein